MTLFSITDTSDYLNELFSGDISGTVHSVYRKTINLSISGTLAALQAKGSPISPISLITTLTSEEMEKLEISVGDFVSLKKNIITISRLDYGKKNDDIIKSFSKIKESNWKLYIIGDGKEFNKLKKLIDDLNLNNKVILTGYKNKEEINKYMLDSSLFLMASITEGLPMVLLEAMSYGIPCIAYEVPSGVNDIIEDGRNGYIIKNRNEIEYIKRIEEVINDSKLRNKLGTNAKEKSKEFSKEKIVKIWENILK